MSRESDNQQTPDHADKKDAAEREPTPSSEEMAGHTEPTSVLALRRLDNIIGLAEQALLALFLLVLIGIGVAQAITIKLGTGLGVWSFEVLRYSVFFIAMTGAALSAQTGQLIAMDFVTRMLEQSQRMRLQVLLRLFTIAACVLLIEGGLNLAETESVSAGASAFIDPALGLLALPIGAGLIGVHVALHLCIDVIYIVRGEVPPEFTELHGAVH